jgi:hypothetical protein
LFQYPAAAAITSATLLLLFFLSWALFHRFLILFNCIEKSKGIQYPLQEGLAAIIAREKQ